MGLGGLGFPCLSASAVPALTFWWRFVSAGCRHRCQRVPWPLAGVQRAGAACYGLCGSLLGLESRLVSLALVLWCALVRCVVSCFAVMRPAGPCCVVVRPALSCRVAPCRAVVCRAVPRRAALCCGVSFLWLPCLGALPRVVPWWGRGVGSVVVGLARVVVWDAGRGSVAGWWPGGAVRCGVARWIRAAGVRVCHSGWWVRYLPAGLPSLGACALVPCPLGALVCSPGCCGRVVFLFWCLCGGPCCGRSSQAVGTGWWAARRCSRRFLR